MLMPERSQTFGSKGYRFAFNGMEQDSEVSGSGNSYDYGFRIYNPRLGKFLSVDPLTSSYPWYTPYQFAGNRPIEMIDLDGLELLNYRSSYHIKFSRDGITDLYYAHYQGNGRSEIPNLKVDGDEKAALLTEINSNYDPNVHPNVKLPDKEQPGIKQKERMKQPGDGLPKTPQEALPDAILYGAETLTNYLKQSFEEWQGGQMRADQLEAGKFAVNLVRDEFNKISAENQEKFGYSINFQLDVANYLVDGTPPEFAAIEEPSANASQEERDTWKANIKAEQEYVIKVKKYGDAFIETFKLNNRQKGKPTKLEYHLGNAVSDH
ncbi:MAG: RHS repeat-associated protein [Halioglobus sp.]|jgi:RHS repeat-associated protein